MLKYIFVGAVSLICLNLIKMSAINKIRDRWEGPLQDIGYTLHIGHHNFCKDGVDGQHSRHEKKIWACQSADFLNTVIAHETVHALQATKRTMEPLFTPRVHRVIRDQVRVPQSPEDFQYLTEIEAYYLQKKSQTVLQLLKTKAEDRRQFRKQVNVLADNIIKKK